MSIIDFNEMELAPLYNKTSKGDQPKWYYDGKWYKLDSLGYEGLSEVVVSRLLADTGKIETVAYEPIRIKYRSRIGNGCVSHDFKSKKEELISLERLHLAYCGTSLKAAMDRYASPEDRIKYTVETIEAITDIHDAGKILTAWLEADAFFLNEDRHTNNIAFLRNPEESVWRFCPMYDNGLSLLSDLNDYPMDEKTSALKKKVKAKPFSTSFSAQVSAAEKLYGNQLNLCFDDTEIENALRGLSEYYQEKYLVRVANILRTQSLISG